MPRPRQIWQACLGLGVLGVCLWILATRLHISTAISEVAVDADARDESRWIGVLGASEPARTMVITVAHAQIDVALDAARELGHRLASDPEVAWVRDRVDADLGSRLHSVYFPRRFRMMSRMPERDVVRRFSDRGLADAAARLRQELARPTGSALKQLAKTDPWLLFVDLMDQFRQVDGGGLQVVDGRFMAGNGTKAVVLLATRHAPMDAQYQSGLHDRLENLIDELSQRYGVVIERSSLHRFAVTSERAIRADIERLSIWSTVGILALMLVVFRTPRMVLLAFVPLVVGVIVATAATVVVFGRVHGLTLAFGTTLLGVCLDYPVHIFTHHMEDNTFRQGTPGHRHVWVALRIGAATTIVGFAALGIAALPGIREIGVFAASGTAAALGAAYVFVQPLLPREIRARTPVIRLARWCSAFIDRSRRHGRWVAVTAGAVLSVSVIAIRDVHWIDDASALNSLSSATLEEDARVRSQVMPTEVGSVLVATGVDMEAALRIQDELFARLEDAGIVARWRSSASMLRSVHLQRRNLAALETVDNLKSRTLRALAAGGFRPEAFEDVDVAEPAATSQLDLQALGEAGLTYLVSPFIADDGDDVALLSFPAGGLDQDTRHTVQSLVNEVPGAQFFEQGPFLARTYQRHREETIPALGVGVLAVFGVLLGRYRSLRRALAVLSPALLAGITTLAIIVAAGTPLHLLHLVAILLVLAIGVDYGVFMVESGTSAGDRSTTVLSIAIGCASTVLSFGVLGMADNPAVQALGLTTALGVVMSAVFAPLAAGFVRRNHNL